MIDLFLLSPLLFLPASIFLLVSGLRLYLARPIPRSKMYQWLLGLFALIFWFHAAVRENSLYGWQKKIAAWNDSNEYFGGNANYYAVDITDWRVRLYWFAFMCCLFGIIYMELKYMNSASKEEEALGSSSCSKPPEVEN